MALTYPLVSISSRLQVQKNDDSKDAYKVTTQLCFFIIVRFNLLKKS